MSKQYLRDILIACPSPRGGGGHSTMSYTVRLCPEVQPPTLLYTIMTEKVLALLYAIMEKKYLFHIGS